MGKRQMLFYKFFEREQYREEFISGELYSNKLSYYRKGENKQAGVKDYYENASIISIADDKHIVNQRVGFIDGKPVVFFDEYKVKPPNYSENQAFIAHGHVDYNVFCLSCIFTDDNLNVIAFDKSNKDNFGQHGAIITNTPEFIRRVCNSNCQNEDAMMYDYGNVNYIDYDSRDNVQEWTPFCKFDTFKAQQEFRFLFKSESSEAIKYKIRPINDICAKIKSKELFFEKISVGANLKEAIREII